MDRLLSSCSPFLLAAVATAQAPAPSVVLPAGTETIRRDNLLAYAKRLAADDMRGRLTGTEGQVMAAEFIADRFAAAGLEPLGDPDKDGQRGWLQHYPVERTRLAEHSGFRLGDQEVREGFALLPWRGDEVTCRGDLVFCGADVQRGAELHGKVPLVLPKLLGGEGLGPMQQFGAAFSALNRIQRAVARAAEGGAEVLVVGILDDEAAITSVLNYVGISPRKPLLRAGEALAELVQLDDMSRMAGGRPRIPVVFTGSKATAALLARAGIDPDAARAFARDGGDPPVPAAGASGEVEVTLALVREKTTATNVVGIVRGSDPELAGEAVVYSAHMDHVGERLDGDAFNGADDNASGTAGLIALAEAYASTDPKPRRSVIFLSVSGEELGLWGSAWFAEHPTFPADKIVANVNTDMIGRGGPSAALGQVMLTPSYRHPQYSSMGRAAAQAAPAIGLELVADDTFFTRSDHYNFVKKGIPAVFLCCAGEHEDYHQVSDHADRLDGEQMEKTARLAYVIGRTIADADQRPEVVGRCTDWLGEPRKKKASTGADDGK